MEKKTRPLSPHIGIYKPQITSVMSILHRITGAYLFLGLMILLWVVTVSVYSAYSGIKLEDYIHLDCIIVKFFLFAWTAAIFYHMFNGVRHLFWDIGKGYEISSVTKSGIFVLLMTFVATIASFYVVYY